MKKFTCFLLAAVGFSLVTNAQITKGSTFLGGYVSFGSTSSERTPNTPAQGSKTKSSQFNFLPQFGIAVGNNKIAGLFFGYSNGTSEQFSNNTLINRNKSKGVGGGFFYRRYYPLSQRFYLFGEGAAGVSLADIESNGYNGVNSYLASKSKTTSVSFALTPGISYAAGRKVFLEAALNDLLSLGYYSMKTDFFNSNGASNGTGKENTFNAALNANGFSGISIGLRWILPGKGK